MTLVRGLYAITPDQSVDSTDLLARTIAILSGGAGILQYRDKHSTTEMLLARARELAHACQQYRVPLIINDHVDMVTACNATGVHLGAHDMPVKQARAVLGPDKIIGVSCYNSLDAALEAQRDGADYVAFGAVFPSPTKPRAVTASLGLLTRATATLSIPVVAIGGINLDNAAAVVRSGVDAIAVISALYNAPNPETAAGKLAALFA